MRQPWVIAHRGASGHAPENTMVAFRRAVELGARFIETDLQMTRDARFVAMHDFTVERTTNGRGHVRDLTLAEIAELDAGKWFDRAFMGEHVPTLEQVLDFARDADILLYLEIKYEVAYGLHHSLAAELASKNDTARVVLLSFDPATLDGIRQFDRTLMTGLLVEAPHPDSVKLAIGVGARQFCPRADLITPELVAEAHASDLHVATWTANKPDQMRRLINAGVDGVMTDFPDRLQAVLQHLEPED
jgi:glycerophosphoryl diester phosphodiesterase